MLKVINPHILHSNIMLENGAEVNGIEEGYVFESIYHQNKKYSKVTLIGEFSIDYNDEDILEDTKIADIIQSGKKTINYQLYVYSDEGPIPHFHLLEKFDTNRRVDTCICIFQAKYFVHGNHTSTLNNKELKILDSFLRSEVSVGVSYWQYIVLIWDTNNEYNKERYPQLRYVSKQPDYTKTNGFIRW